jgi:chromosome segregation ATPase
MARDQNVSKADLIGEAVKDFSLSSSGLSTDKVRAFNHHLAQMKMVFLEAETERARLSRAHIYSEDEFQRKLLAQKVELEKETLATQGENRELKFQLERLQREVSALKELKENSESEAKRLSQAQASLQRTLGLLEQRNADLEARVARYPADLKENETLKDKLRSLEIAYGKLEAQYEISESRLAEQKTQFEEKVDMLVKTSRAEVELLKREKVIAEGQV